MKKSLTLAGCGFIMGLADLFPGISGGTVAFILGIWEQLILSLGDLGRSLFWFKAKKKGSFKGAFLFLMPLILGIALAIFLFTKTVDSLLNNPQERVLLYSTFIGLIAASSLLCIRKIQKKSRATFTLFLVSMLLAIGMTYLKPTAKESALYHVPLQLLPTIEHFDAKNIDREKGAVNNVEESILLAMLSRGLLKPHQQVIDAKNGSGVPLSFIHHKKGPSINLWIVFCGSAAISAMLLPGISGSYLLVVLGMYGEVISNTADFISSLKQGSFDGDSFIFLSQFALGLLIGAGVFSKLIGSLFERYRDAALAMLAGFVLGSLRAVWPFWTFSFVIDPLRVEKGPRLLAESPFLPNMHDFTLLTSIAMAVAGFGLVVLIEYLAERKKKLYLPANESF